MPDDENKIVTVADLLSFFAHPQRWFVRKRLGIRLDTEAELPGESELFALNGLDSYLVNQELVQACLDKTTEPQTATLARLKAQGRWMLGTPGQLAFDQQFPELSAFAGKIQAKDMGRSLPDIPIDLQVGEYRLIGQLADIHGNGILLARYSKCKGKDLLKAWISHLLLAAATPAPATTHLLTKDLDLCFPPCADPQARLGELMTIYHEGYCSPSPLLVEPAWVYLQQQNKKRAQKSPLETAAKSFRDSLEQGYEPELTLLYGSCDPDTLLGPEFLRLCEEFLGPIWSETTDQTLSEAEQNP